MQNLCKDYTQLFVAYPYTPVRSQHTGITALCSNSQKYFGLFAKKKAGRVDGFKAILPTTF